MSKPAASAKASHVTALVAHYLETLAEMTKDPTMSMQQVQLLLQLSIHGQITQYDLPRFTGVEKSANSRNIAKLGIGERPHIKAGPGYVESYEDPMNRRLKLVRLTPKGRGLIESAAQKSAQYL